MMVSADSRYREYGYCRNQRPKHRDEFQWKSYGCQQHGVRNACNGEKHSVADRSTESQKNERPHISCQQQVQIRRNIAENAAIDGVVKLRSQVSLKSSPILEKEEAQNGH